jgi:hypothetical protein
MPAGESSSKLGRHAGARRVGQHERCGRQ